MINHCIPCLQMKLNLAVSLMQSHAKQEEESSFGKCQSPINIITVTPPCNGTNNHSSCHESVVQLHKGDFNTNGLKFTYPEQVKHCTIVNNGHTVQVNIPSSAYGMEMRLDLCFGIKFIFTTGT
eukprot:262630_1